MAYENPSVSLFNVEGVELAVSASQPLTGSGVQPGILVAGSSSTGIVQFMKVATDGAVFVTGSVGISSVGAVDQGTAGTVGQSWFVTLTDGTQAIGTGSSAPVWVTGAVDISNPVIISDGGGTISVDDGGGLLTVDGTVAVTDGGGSITVDGTVDITDGGGSITVDGTVTAQVTGTVNLDRGNSSADPLWVSGSFTANFDPATSTTVTPVSSSLIEVTLQAANIERRALTIFNDSTKILFLKLGSGVTTTSFTLKVSPKGYYEVPGNYTGIVTGLWENENGFAYVTEVLN